MMKILVSLQIHAIQVFQHATISWSDVISSSGANKAFGISARPHPWLAEVVLIRFQQSGGTMKAECLRATCLPSMSEKEAGQRFDRVYHGALLPSTYVDDLERLQDVVNHWCGIEASFCIRVRFRFLLWGFEPFELAMMPW